MKKAISLQDTYLSVLQSEKVQVSIFMANGIRLQGTIDSFDQFVIVLKNVSPQVVYKHAISTIMPSRSVKLPMQGDDS